jgi:hypothetical protein
MKYVKGDMVEIVDPGSPFDGRIGAVIFADHEALRVDVCPKWYWGEGDVRVATVETYGSLRALPKGTIVSDTVGLEWVKVGPDIWATTQTGSLHGCDSLNLSGRRVTRTFLGRMA